MEALTLLELNGLVRGVLEHSMNRSYWLQAEISELRTASNGHCYLEFVQKDARGNGFVAKARGNIWANVYRMLKPYFERETGQAFCAGMKVLVEVQVTFHELYGYSLNVTDIDPTYTVGDMVRRRREILRQLADEGVLNLNKELDFPVLPQRIAVISSAEAAGYDDFCHQLQNNSRGYFFHTELFKAWMQGNRVEDSVLAALDEIAARRDEFDVVVIIRGGGATSDLSGFDTYMLAAACAQFPLPVITGIGHERDDTVLDSVAHTRVKTPTAAAEYLIVRMDEAAEQLDRLAFQLREGVMQMLRQARQELQSLSRQIPTVTLQRLQRERKQLDALTTRIPASAVRQLANARIRVAATRQSLLAVVGNQLQRERHRLEMIAQRMKDVSPQRQFERGYSLTLKEGKIVKDAAQLKTGDRIVTRLGQGEVTSTVE